MVGESHHSRCPARLSGDALTDGYTGWPDKPVGPHVMACLTRASTAENVPEWIQTVILNLDE